MGDWFFNSLTNKIEHEFASLTFVYAMSEKTRDISISQMHSIILTLTTGQVVLRRPGWTGYDMSTVVS